MVDREDRLPRAGLHEVDPREIWPDEAADFTPWLANNLGALHQRLGFELLNPTTEVRIGNVKADIVAVSPGGAAVIENQLEPSDPKHLGQLLTYVSGRDDVSVAIWVASRFKPEHRKALGRLNEWSPAKIDFYGVEVAAIQIGDSEVVSDFRPVAFPQDWDRHRRSGSVHRSATARHRSFFDDLLSALSPSGAVRVIGSDHDLRRLRWAGDPVCATYRAQFLRRDYVSVALVIELESLSDTKFTFDRLYEQRGRIESEIGAELQWSRQPGRRTSIIRWRGGGTIHGSEAELEQVSRWMHNSLARLRAVCSPRLDSILARLGVEVE